MDKAKKNNKMKMFWLYLLSFGVNILPLLIVIIFNWDDCTKTEREGLALTVAGIFWVIFLIVSMLNSVPFKVNRVVVLVVLFVLLLLMKPLLNLMAIFCGASAFGAMVDTFVVKPIIKRQKEKKLIGETAEETTKQIKAVMQEIIKEQENKGRV